MKAQLMVCGALLLAGCAGSPGSGSSTAHNTRTIGKSGASVRVVHFSAPW